MLEVDGFCDARPPVSDVGCDGCREEHVASKHAVVVVAYAQAIVVVIHFREEEG